MNKIILILLSFCLYQFGIAQYNFQKIISNANATYARDVIQHSDTGYYVTGSSSGYGDYSANAFLMKLDKLGNWEWTTYYGGNNADWAVRFVQNADKSFVFAGYTNSYGNGGYDIWIFKTDSLGVLLWEKNYGGSDWDFARSIISTNDGGYMVCGETYSYGNGNNDAFLLKLDVNGDSTWMKTYGGTEKDWAEKVIQTQDGRYVFIGSTNSPPAQLHNAWVLKTDANGNEVWQKLYGSSTEDFGNAIVESQLNGELLLVGSTDSVTAVQRDIFFIKADSLGYQLCYSPYGGTDNETVHDLVQRHNNNVFMAGQSYSYGFYGDFINYESDLGCWWQGGPTYGTNEVEEPWSVKVTSDSGFVMVGDTKDGPGMSSVFIVKLDLGEIWGPAITNYFDVTEVEEILEENYFSIYPNPSAGTFQIVLPEDFNSGKLEIYGMDGRLLLIKELGHSTPEFNLTQFENGIYLIRLTELKSGKNYHNKLILSR